MLRVGVLGALGKMGQTVRAAVVAAPDLELVAAVDPRAEAGDPAVSPSIEALAESGADVAVDFTVAASAVANLSWCAEHGVDAVCGTSGIDPEAMARLAAAFSGPARPNAIVAANFSLSAIVLLRLAEIAAPYFDGVEVIELHHDEKVDAPSATAIETARRLASARLESGRGPFRPDPVTTVTVDGARGGVGPGGVHIHAVRLRGLVAHEEVVFGAEGQSLTLRQDAYDRTSYMPGVLLAVRSVGDSPGLTIGLDSLLDL